MAHSLTKMDLDPDHYVIAAAIDFGTTRSGFAFSTKTKPNDIIMNKNWGSEFGHASYKCPTSVLTNSKGDFVSFGYIAENDYTVKLEEGRDDYHLYRHFKMMLHQNKKLTMKTTIKSMTGKARQAIDIFTMAIEYLKDEMLKLLRQQQISTLDESLIRWVITVPAIWKDEAKRFMREASFKAGLITNLESKALTIALEPEAASMYCRGMELKLYHQGKEEDKAINFSAGEKYVIIDAGGGTVDITCHEVQEHRKVKEIHPATGGAWGSINIDKNFEQLMKDVIGAEFMTAYQAKCPQNWFRFMLEFERGKMAFKLTENQRTNIMIPYSLCEKYEEDFNEEITEAFKGKGSSHGVDFDNGAVAVRHEKMKELIASVLANTVKHVQNLLQKKELQDVKYILLVGGLGQCRMLQNEIQKEFGNLRSILTPMDGQLAIIKGAVIFGHNPTNISTRIAKLTYGFGMMRPFDKSLHKKEYLVHSDDKEWCDNIFDVAITKDQDVDTGSVVKFDLRASEAGRKKGFTTVSIYNTPNVQPLYTTEENINKLASLKIAHTPNTTHAPIAVHFVVGGTELLVKAQDKKSQQWVETSVDFLSEEK